MIPPSDSATDDEEEALLVGLIIQLDGNQSAIARILCGRRKKGQPGFITRQGVKMRLLRFGLFGLANEMGIEAELSGNRKIPAEIFARKREELLAFVASFPTTEAARADLGWIDMTLRRRLVKFQITREQIEERRAAVSK